MTTGQETLFIGGAWVPPSSAATIEVDNASTGEHILGRELGPGAIAAYQNLKTGYA
jgi:hypothetical protein